MQVNEDLKITPLRFSFTGDEAMQRNATLTIITTGLFLMLYASAQAQTMYRCGNVYQDRPCADQPGRVIGNNTKASPPPTELAIDGECSQRGAAALKIVWARESGRTEEMQLSSSTHPGERKLISDVYRKRGSSVDVRSAIEADCVAEKERAAQAAALINAAGKLTAQDRPAPTSTQNEAAEAAARAAARKGLEASAEQRKAADKKARCDTLTARVDSIRKQQRSGGSVSVMEGLNQQHRDADKALGEAGC